MKPGIKTIVAGGVMFLMGAFVVPLLFILPLILEHDQDAQFKAPGSIEVTAKKPGRYYLWNDYRTVYNGKSYDRSESIPDGLEIQIRAADGHELQFVSHGSISTSGGSSAKKSIGYVGVEHPGKVTVQVTGGSEDRILSFSQSGLLRMFGLILGGFGLSMIVAIGGIGLIIWGILKLVRANRKGEPNAAPNGGPATRLGNSGVAEGPPSVS
jgi:hypothetical protein